MAAMNKMASISRVDSPFLINPVSRQRCWVIDFACGVASMFNSFEEFIQKCAWQETAAYSSNTQANARLNACAKWNKFLQPLSVKTQKGNEAPLISVILPVSIAMFSNKELRNKFGTDNADGTLICEPAMDTYSSIRKTTREGLSVDIMVNTSDSFKTKGTIFDPEFLLSDEEAYECASEIIRGELFQQASFDMPMVPFKRSNFTVETTCLTSLELNKEETSTGIRFGSVSVFSDSSFEKVGALHFKVDSFSLYLCALCGGKIVNSVGDVISVYAFTTTQISVSIYRTNCARVLLSYTLFKYRDTIGTGKTVGGEDNSGEDQGSVAMISFTSSKGATFNIYVRNLYTFREFLSELPSMSRISKRALYSKLRYRIRNDS